MRVTESRLIDLATDGVSRGRDRLAQASDVVSSGASNSSDFNSLSNSSTYFPTSVEPSSRNALKVRRDKAS